MKSSSFSKVTLSVWQECYLYQGKNKSDLRECSSGEQGGLQALYQTLWSEKYVYMQIAASLQRVGE